MMYEAINRFGIRDWKTLANMTAHMAWNLTHLPEQQLTLKNGGNEEESKALVPYRPAAGKPKAA